MDDNKNSSDQRKYPRERPLCILQVVHPYTNEVIGKVINISRGGVMITSSQPVPIGWKTELRLESEHKVLPEPIVFYAISKWCQEDLNPKYYDIGLAFVDPPAILLKHIESLMHYLSFLKAEEAERKKPNKFIS